MMGAADRPIVTMDDLQILTTQPSKSINRTVISSALHDFAFNLRVTRRKSVLK